MNSNIEDSNSFVESHIKYIRRMALLTDDQLRILLKSKIASDRSLVEKFKDNEMKKQYNELSQIANVIKTEPKKIARRVDEFQNE